MVDPFNDLDNACVKMNALWYKRSQYKSYQRQVSAAFLGSPLATAPDPVPSAAAVSIAHLGPLQRVVRCCQGTMSDAPQMRTYGSGHFNWVRQRGHMAGFRDEPEGAIAHEASNDLG